MYLYGFLVEAFAHCTFLPVFLYSPIVFRYFLRIFIKHYARCTIVSLRNLAESVLRHTFLCRFCVTHSDTKGGRALIRLCQHNRQLS